MNVSVPDAPGAAVYEQAGVPHTYVPPAAVVPEPAPDRVSPSTSVSLASTLTATVPAAATVAASGLATGRSLTHSTVTVTTAVSVCAGSPTVYEKLSAPQKSAAGV